MSKVKQYKRSVRFRDKNINLFNVTIEVAPAKICKHIDGKWVQFDGPMEAAFTGDWGLCCGQCVDSIEPHTSSQAKLIEYWKKYHWASNLKENLPMNYIELFNELCDEIESDEVQYTEESVEEFDMGAEDFVATPEIIQKVQRLYECGENVALALIALGMHLGYTYGDIDETFQVEDWKACRYSAFGMDFYIGTESQLEEVARDYLDDGAYDDLWREAVRAQDTELGLQDWLNEVLQYDGWCNILNHYDGKFSEYLVGEKYICVSRR